MPEDTPHTRTLARAAKVLGGEQPLAGALGVTLVQLRAWMSGQESPPTEVFTAALDIVARGQPPGG